MSRPVAAGLLDGGRVRRRLSELLQQILAQALFWLPSAMLSALDGDPAERLDLHPRAAMALFVPCCTPAGRRRLEALLDGRSIG